MNLDEDGRGFLIVQHQVRDRRSLISLLSDAMPTATKLTDGPTGTESVFVHRRGQFITVRPPVSELEKRFITVCHGAANDEEFGFCVMPVGLPLFDRVTLRDGRPAQSTFAGLEPQIVEMLHTMGRKVVASASKLASLPVPDLTPMAAWKRVDHGMLEFIHAHERGIIRYDRRGKVRPALLIAQMALAWPNAKIVVVVTRRAAARQLHHALEAILPEPVGLSTSRHSAVEYRRVFVATPSRLGTGPLAIERRHLYIAVNPDELFGTGMFPLAIEGLRHAHMARVFGVLPVGADPAARRRDHMTALFGPEECTVPAHGRRLATVDVMFLRVVGGPPIPQIEGYDLKRSGIYEHPVRNRRLVKLAQALLPRNARLLASEFPAVANAVRNRPNRIVLYTDHFDHALDLTRKLDCPLVTGPDLVDVGLGHDDLERIEMGRDLTIRTTWSVVATAAGLKHAGTFDVLIRADGGIGLPPLSLASSTVPEGESHRILVLDMRDDHHHELAHWTASRRKTYSEAGWAIFGQVPMTPLQKFQATRPRVRA